MFNIFNDNENENENENENDNDNDNDNDNLLPLTSYLLPLTSPTS